MARPLKKVADPWAVISTDTESERAIWEHTQTGERRIIPLGIHPEDAALQTQAIALPPEEDYEETATDRIAVLLQAAQADARAEEILSGMGLASKMDQGCNQLSQVELRKLELARAMAADPQLLISDEAMAGLAGTEIDEVLAILHSLNRKGITIIMIEHIMQAVMSFSERVVCLDAGQIICEGTPAEVVANPFVQRAYLGD
ncbi:MAG: ATP-binding cassette domain-containing protein [Betaproteobacteria bacterium]|nr:ATP-binding cassette domain-containing protein [Betaproteobacteria bacterium]